ncbi:MAG TPA: hypothetical protein VLU94_00150, partial [Candidatus Nitrosotalea sp.]|nr:hypothetical protein [Candidatus Nitrosotalea sp.]
SGVNPTTVPGLSSDGRYVTFESVDGDLVPNDRNHDYDVFLRDLTTGTTELISARNPGLPSRTPNGGPGVISPFSVSANGRYVAFSSQSDDLVANQPATYRNIFVHDLLTGTNILVSVDTNGVAAAGISMDPSISGDGRYVAFSSTADNLVPGDTNKVEDVFVRDLQTGTTTLVSLSTNGVDPGNYQSLSPTISTDGRYVLFQSTATDLAPGLGGLNQNLFMRDLQTGTTYALTTQQVGSYAMTPDGRFVALVHFGAQQLLVWDSQSHGMIYTNSSNRPAFVTISPDGRRLAYQPGVPAANVTVVDLIENTNWVLSASPYSIRSGPQFTADGKFLVLTTTAPFWPSDTNGNYDVYLWDIEAGTNILVSRSFTSFGAANGASDSPAISADGRFVAYRSTASNTVPNDFNDVPDLVVYDRVSGASSLISVSQSGNFTVNNRSLNPVFSGDGRTLVFQSWASDLLDDDFNNGIDLFALKLGSETFVDSDGDGMDDAWEVEHFGTLDRDGTGDFDGDGATDLFEFLTGTDPTNALSVFRVEIISVTGSGQSPAMTWSMVPGKFYHVQFKDDLSNPAWQELQGNVTLVGGRGYATDLVPANGQRFYRVLLEP